MKTGLIPYFTLIALFSINFISCQKSGGPDNEPNPTDSVRHIITYNDSRLVTGLNGYRFDAAFGTGEPQAYPYLWIQYVDDYLDSTRILVLVQNEFKSITQYQVGNHFEGNLTRKFDHATFPNNAAGNMSFTFNHDMFLLNSYDPESGTISETGTVFGMNTQASHIFTGMLDQYRYQFLNRFLIRYISGISIWPFNYPNWTDQPQFVATSELSEPKAIAHYFDETFSTFPWDVQSNMYSGFFQATLAGNYVGIAKGTANLDTLFFDAQSPDLYSVQLCQAYIDKVGDTLYLGVLVNVPGTSELTANLYRLEINSGSMEKIYTNVSFPYGSLAFRRGYFYTSAVNGGQYVRFNKQGIAETYGLPVTTNSMSLIFSKNRIFVIITGADSDKRTEVYSKPL
jgi:hypothetical protein